MAFISIARELAGLGNEVTLAGSGTANASDPYRFVHVPAVARQRFEKWPTVPALRSPENWEDATFAAGLMVKVNPADFDATVTCAFPFTHWALRRPSIFGEKSKHVFVTQNGDWPARSNDAEFRFFGCDGLVCTNPDYFEQNSPKFRCALIPNGVDLNRFAPGQSERARFGLPANGPIVLMVSAFIASKNIAEGIAAMAHVPEANLVVAGDGPLREDMKRLAAELIPGRFHQLTVPATEMPALYRSADVFMHLSTDESFGNVFVEAMATGMPIVAWDTPRTRWIVGESAPLPSVRNSDALAAAIANAIDRGDSDLADNRKRAARFSWSSVGKQYHQFLSEVVAE